MTSQRVLVTGATGFLGRHLVNTLLGEGYTVAFTVRDSSSSVEIAGLLENNGAQALRYSNSESLRSQVVEFTPEIIFHLATLYAKTHDASQIDALVEANVTFGATVLDAVRGSRCVVVSAMSFFQYRNNVPVSNSLYSALKEAFSVVSDYYRTVGEVDIREVVLYDTYGPYDNRDKLLPHLIREFSSGSVLGLGPSAQPINLLHARDVAYGFIAVAQAEAVTRTSLRAESNTTVGGVVELLRSISGRDMVVSFDDARPLNNLVTESGDWPTPAGWSSEIGLAHGLEEYWNSHQLADGRQSP